MHPVFLLDEAHLMRDEVLQHLHILSNYSWDQKPLLPIVLVGLPDLWRRLSLGVHRSLWSRINCRVALERELLQDAIDADVTID
ncbi:MAG: ATP-binding protein [Myxococcales bacterium]|nr:ATP-binding protein [Myxococcales bacterium]